jgi:hypothetical protein
MNDYEKEAMVELAAWEKEMRLLPSLVGELAKKLQNRINRAIPEKIHQAITAAIKQMTRAVIFGSGFISGGPLDNLSLEEREAKAKQRIKFYKNTAATEGALTGAAGVLVGLADFPLWLTLKMKLLHDIAAIYGYDVKDLRERIYILYIFQLTFSSQKQRNKTYAMLANWHTEKEQLPGDIHEFDWKTFQLEYRDYIDIAKLLQLVPGIGAAVGAYVNHRLTKKLGNTAMNAYRLRWRAQKALK